MHLDKANRKWRRLPLRSKTQIVLLCSALVAATSIQVIARPGNDNEPNVQRGNGSTTNATNENVVRSGNGPNVNVVRSGNGPNIDVVRSGQGPNINVQRSADASNNVQNDRDRDRNRDRNRNRDQDRDRRNVYAPNQQHLGQQDRDRLNRIHYTENQRRADNSNQWRNDRHDRDRWNNNNNRSNNQSNRASRQINNRWDSRLDNRRRYQAYSGYRNNWNAQRTYLNSNLRNFNQLAQLNQMQQAQLDAQMRSAYLAYHNNQWNGPYGWDNYSEPQFLDYLQANQPSVLQSILSALGMGADGGYLYSSNWGSERSQLAQNMARIHQLALDGRITARQERELTAQLRAEFMAYRNNNWDRSIGWSQYSDPGFIDYLNDRKPSLLMTVRDYLVR